MTADSTPGTGEVVVFEAPLTRWAGDKAVYHLVTLVGEAADAITMHERIRRLELGARRGFGSVKVLAQIGDTRWKTSVFPQKSRSEWILLVGKKVIRAEDLTLGELLRIELELI